MAERGTITLYNGPPTWAELAGWLLIGIGGFVLVPLTLVYRAWWLLVPAIPLLVAGLLLFGNRLHITLDHRTGSIQVTNHLLGLRLRQRVYPHGELVMVDVQRVAGAKQERPSDTWYLRLRFRTQTHTIGRFTDRISALQAQERLEDLITTQRPMRTPEEMRSLAEERLRGQPESAEARYQMGLALMLSGDSEGARRTFRQALELATKPLLRRMIEQRLDELGER